ncbi:MAG: hypothetical protein PHR83_18245 [Paludibacter sp.]|nr:hypothetical protein [Paludibacter sp.]
MNQLKTALFIAITFLTSCTAKVTNDHSVGDPETAAYKTLSNKLIEDMKREFGGNMYESEKITPIETAEGIKIGIPDGTFYLFTKDNSKFLKGDLNNDKKFDLIIRARMNEKRGLETKKYFVFLQGKEGYEYVAEFKADDMVFENCRKMADLKVGTFNLDSISGGLLIGSTNYQSNNESYYKDYSYRCDTEKYKINLKDKTTELVFQSDLLKKNSNTGKYEKVTK